MLYIAWLIIFAGTGTVLAAMFFVAYGVAKVIEAETNETFTREN